MNSGHEINITIDNRAIRAERGLTILQVAQRHDIYIPTLCAHKDLTPFGGCRMCIVEVEKMRGLPTACTTPVDEGMVIRTHTAQVHAVRLEILQLILSEHTSSCLICDEKEECKGFSTTIRKAGVTTGCRYCPNDQQCELQRVAEKLELKEIGYPIYYRNLPVEKDDPFFDRDYNLCILCGRCVRMCQDIRTAGTLAFTKRGRNTVIGPAFHRTHMDAGCEFCGACVSVCPTGALSEKSNKWDGKAEREETSTCPLCGLGCQLRLQVKGNAVIGVLPAEAPLVNDGQLCVKGRFCITETVNGCQRLLKPYVNQYGRKALIDWERAVELAAEKLAACHPNEFGMLVSPDCCNEDLYVAQKFTRVAMRSHHIDTSARLFYGPAFGAYVDLLASSVPFSEIQKASAILCVGLDARFGRSVVGVALRKAVSRGAKVITIHPRRHSLSVISDLWIRPVPGAEIGAFRTLVQLTGPNGAASTTGKDETGVSLAAAAALLNNAAAPVILVGEEFVQFNAGPVILEAISQLALNLGAGVILLPAHNNLSGVLLMGACPELLPGGFPSASNERAGLLGQRWRTTIPEFHASWNAASLSPSNKLKVLYLAGEAPPHFGAFAEFKIFQNLYPPEPFDEADLILPAAAFSEVDGTFTNGERRFQRVRQAVPPPGESLADWQILCRIARKMGVAGFEFGSVPEIQEEISSVIPGGGPFDGVSRTVNPFRFEGRVVAAAPKAQEPGEQDGALPFILHGSVNEHGYRGFPLTSLVEGARKLFVEEVVAINPGDAAARDISDGNEIILIGDRFERIVRARIDRDQPAGTLHMLLRHGETFDSNPLRVTTRKRDVQGNRKPDDRTQHSPAGH